MTALSSCPFQSFLAVGYRDGSIKLFDVSDTENPKVVYCGHKAAITCFCWHEERVLISGSKVNLLNV